MGAVDPVWALGALGTAGSALIMLGRQVVLSRTVRAVERERQMIVRHLVDGLTQQALPGGFTVVVLTVGPGIPADAADLSREQAA